MIETANQSNIRDIIQKSAEKTVLLYVFDPQDPKSQALTQTLENAVGQNNDYIMLAEADVQDPAIYSICAQVGISSLPAICVLKEGRPVDLVLSDRLANPEAVPGLIASFLPAKEKILLSEAVKLEEAGNNHEAYAKLQEAFEIAPKDTNIRFGFANIAIKTKKLEKARELLAAADPADQQSQIFKDLMAALTLAEKNLENPETKILENRHHENPDDLSIAEQLATAWSQDGKTEQALQMLLDYLKKDLNAGNIKKVYLDILSTLNGDPLQAKYRRAIYSLMY
ncbi:tetratricopeptide repeat protein [Succinimonas amylolytica]|uniref:tetratricopeptide repeat protein n=1 Tax=Succinimonas amylolytica TaxID=83769 RepID=UPI00037C58AD|nr:tetratricopeptide repeat protein [Succinimonas amylolytica]